MTLPRYAYVTPIIDPSGGGITGVQTVVEYGDRNSYRMSNFHRLDASIDFIKQKRKYERRWSIGFYNMYNRANPFYIDFKQGYINSQTVIQRSFGVQEVSLIPIIPFISYNFKF